MNRLAGRAIRDKSFLFILYVIELYLMMLVENRLYSGKSMQLVDF